MNLHIVGAGPAGLAAAHAALEAGAEVCLIDDNHAAGGQVWRGGPEGWGDPRASRFWQTLHGHPRFTHLRNARVIGCAGANTLLLEAEGRGRRLAFERLLICSGARELFLPFPGWTLPGVTGAGGLQALLKGGMPVRHRAVVVAGSGPLLLATAVSAIAAGARVQAIVEQAAPARLARFGLGCLLRHRKKFRQALSLFAALRSVPYLAGARIVEATGTDRLRGVAVDTGRAQVDYPCDFLAAGFGLVPDSDLAQVLGCDIVAGAIRVDMRQRSSRADIWAAGECTGIGGVEKAIAEGRIAALDALGAGPGRRELAALRQGRDFAALLARGFALDASLRDMCRPGTIICRCEDVPAASLAPQRDWREAKLATRVGMGACQGKTCGAACAFLYGWPAPPARLPIAPASAAALADID